MNPNQQLARQLCFGNFEVLDILMQQVNKQVIIYPATSINYILGLCYQPNTDFVR